jgi:hypothetical protein
MILEKLSTRVVDERIETVAFDFDRGPLAGFWRLALTAN